MNFMYLSAVYITLVCGGMLLLLWRFYGAQLFARDLGLAFLATVALQSAYFLHASAALPKELSSLLVGIAYAGAPSFFVSAIARLMRTQIRVRALWAFAALMGCFGMWAAYNSAEGPALLLSGSLTIALGLSCAWTFRGRKDLRSWIGPSLVLLGSAT